MIQKVVTRLDEKRVLDEFPVSDRVKGWYFRVHEVSAGAYHAEGTDLWGRRVSHTGGDPDTVLENCVSDAKSIAMANS